LLAGGVHQYWAHKYPEEFRAWWKKRIGEERFEKLKMRSWVKGPFRTSDIIVVRQVLRIRLKELRG
jgi:hypothetical protein